ncbi:glutaredoxin [Lipingzhangella halophila]|uniref:Glutaredoxin n=1 Tax=Lipingzhangella halophila TaxID=1783352 RepID=A0A7W7RD65_9ACTN|nr:glutaredoxin domain-containing protein [Lipingzhangella halophila]MBB4929615.1 glutaredoxin [Lipingzhangella halophila]
MSEEPADSVIFYWRPGCPFCFALRRNLRKERVPFHQVNIWSDESAAARVRVATGGDETVPTVVVGSQTMVNPSVAAVLDAARTHAPHLLEQREREGPAAAPARGLRGWLARLRAGR